MPTYVFLFFNDTATTEIYTLSLHDALPISEQQVAAHADEGGDRAGECVPRRRSEEHTSELQSQSNLVCRLLLEKKKTKQKQDLVAHPDLHNVDPHSRRVHQAGLHILTVHHT